MTSSPDSEKPRPRPSYLRRFFSCLYLAVLIGLVIGTLATFLAKQHWIAEVFCHGRIQLTIALAVWFLLAAIFKQKLRAFVSLTFLVVNAVWIVPYFVPNPATTGSPTIKIMSANVLTSNRQFESFIETVNRHDPDVVIVLEVNQEWKNEIEGALLTKYPHQNIVAMSHNFGIGIVSKVPFASVDPIIAPDTELMSLDARFTGPSGRPFRLIATHPFPPLSQPCFVWRSQHLIRLAKMLDPNEDNVIAGDFNLTPWSPVFTEMLAAGDLKDSRLGFGVAATWYAYPTFFASLQIDHLLVSQSLTTVNHEVSENYGSDHRAVIAEFEQPEVNMPNRPAPLPASSVDSKSDAEPQDALVYSAQ